MTVFNKTGITIAKPAPAAFDQALAKAQSINAAAPPKVVDQATQMARDGVVTAKEYDELLGVARRDLTLGPIVKGSVDTFDVRVLEGLLANRSLQLHPEARARIEADVEAAKAALERGEIRAGAFVDKEGVIHELCQGKIDVPYERFVATMDPADWSPNLAQYRGGEVRELGRQRDARGHEFIHQQERMAIGSLPNVLDMTKNTVVDKGPEASRVTWEVVHSDATAATLFMRTVQRDNGYIEFAKTVDGKVLVTTRSAHLITTPISKLARGFSPRLTGELTARQMADYFTKVIERYRSIALGKVPARAVERP